MKEAVLKVQRDEDFEDQSIAPEKSKAKDTKIHPRRRILKIPMSITEEYKHADPEKRMHMWYMFRGLRDEFDKIEQDSNARVCGIGSCNVTRR